MGIPTIHNEGWKITISEQLISSGIELTVAFPYDIRESEKRGIARNIRYIVFPNAESDSRGKKILAQENAFTRMFNDNDYNVIHIWGTEFSHSFTAVKVAEATNCINKVVVSIQGIAEECALHYYTGVDYKYIKKQYLIDRLRKKSIYLDAKSMLKRGLVERKTIKEAKNIIGRTNFDKNYIKLINPVCNYYFCNETLRKCFYDGAWNREKCALHNIFMSQGNYSLKGLHYALKAIAIVKKYYPDVKLIVAGGDILKLNEKETLIRKLLARHAYPEFLKKIIKENDLYANVECVGVLDSEQMKKQYLSCNVYLMASNIENSPNSLGEAMLLGVPCIASNVGGVSSVCSDGTEGILYQHDDYYMLASEIIRLFSDPELQNSLSEGARKRATITHDANKNYDRLMEIYGFLF